MTTQIFKSRSEFTLRKDKSINGVSQSFADENPKWVEDRENKGCWNCSGCSDCSDIKKDIIRCVESEVAEMSTIEILQNSLKMTDETPPPMPPELYMPTDAEFERYLRAKHAEVMALRNDGYGSVNISIYGSSRSNIITRYAADFGVSQYTGSSLTEAIKELAADCSPAKEAAALRRNAQNMLSRAAELESVQS